MQPYPRINWFALIAIVVTANVRVPAAEAPPLVAVYGDVVHTMAGPPIEKGVVVIDGGKITLVGSALDIPVPPAARVVRGKVVTPGLIDAHVHLDSDAGGEAALVEGVTSSAATNALRAQWNGMKTLRAGLQASWTSLPLMLRLSPEVPLSPSRAKKVRSTAGFAGARKPRGRRRRSPPEISSKPW
jgi:hypothetical protein